jgi:hypothetical protein
MDGTVLNKKTATHIKALLTNSLVDTEAATE